MPAVVQWARAEAGHVSITQSSKQLLVGIAVVKARSLSTLVISLIVRKVSC